MHVRVPASYSSVTNILNSDFFPSPSLPNLPTPSLQELCFLSLNKVFLWLHLLYLLLSGTTSAKFLINDISTLFICPTCLVFHYTNHLIYEKTSNSCPLRPESRKKSKQARKQERTSKIWLLPFSELLKCQHKIQVKILGWILGEIFRWQTLFSSIGLPTQSLQHFHFEQSGPSYWTMDVIRK